MKTIELHSRYKTTRLNECDSQIDEDIKIINDVEVEFAIELKIFF